MAKIAAWVFGVIFILAGVWGFFAQPAVWFIAADVTSSIVHVLVGLALVLTAGKASVAKTLKTVGVLYVIFAVLGFIQGTAVFGGVFLTDMVTNWFYLVVGIVIAALGFASKGGSSTPAPTAPSAPQM